MKMVRCISCIGIALAMDLLPPGMYLKAQDPPNSLQPLLPAQPKTELKAQEAPALTQNPNPTPPGNAEKPRDLFQSSHVPISPEELAAIEIGRKGAKPRPVMARGPLNAVEAARVRIFKAAKPSVVYISSATAIVIKDLQSGDTSDLPLGGTGTGFIWDEMGHVVTNYHVIQTEDKNGIPIGEAENLQVKLSNGKTYHARRIGRNMANDIAVLRIFAPLKDMKPLPLGRSKDLQVGQSVLAIGNPLGLDHTMTEGIISGVGRTVLTLATIERGIIDAIQTDAAINPGNSGGPLLDSAGRLIGMNTSVGVTSVSFAIPVDTLNQIVPMLIAKGQVDRPSLGFTAVSHNYAVVLGVTKGAIVGYVEPGSVADRAGLRGWVLKEGASVPELGDIIIGFQGRPVDDQVQLLDFLEIEPPGADLVFSVIRNGALIQITMSPSKAKAPNP